MKASTIGVVFAVLALIASAVAVWTGSLTLTGHAVVLAILAHAQAE